MTEKRINQMEPWVGEEEKEELAKVIDSGWITEAERTREFEQVFADYVGTRYAAAVSNGTVSLTVALMAMGIGEGDQVIVPDLTMIASANSVILAGATPVLADVDSKTLCLDLAATEEAITEKTKAIMPVHLNGRHPDMKGLATLARRRGLFILEDAAQALGCWTDGKHLGSLGDMGSFSLSTPKVITTGQGGMITTDDEGLHRNVLWIKDFGRRRRSEDWHVTMGFNFKFTDILAAVGLAQMRKLDWRIQRKKEIYRLYRELLQDVEAVTFVDTNLEETSPWFIDILVEDREALCAHLASRNIGTRPFYPPIHTQVPYAHVRGRFPHSEAMAAKGLWLPSSSFLTDDDVERVCREIRAYYQHPKSR